MLPAEYCCLVQWLLFVAAFVASLLLVVVATMRNEVL